jgi:hypothetical protein
MMSVTLKRIIVATFDFDVAKLECIWQVELESFSKSYEAQIDLIKAICHSVRRHFKTQNLV